MENKEKILLMLKEALGQPVSGQEIASSLNISRAAVWKSIKNLEELGYEISAKPNKGYALTIKNEYNKYEIGQRLKTKIVGKRIEFFESLDSTNDYAKNIGMKEDSEGKCIIACEQKKGRGRMNRNFYSPKDNGVYFSVILKPQIIFKDLSKITVGICVSILDAIEEMTGQRPNIKWPNDIEFNRKKVCGILTECMLEAESGKVEYMVVGIGINVTNKSFPSNIKDIATSIKNSTGKEIDRSSLVANILNKIDEIYQMDSEQLNDIVLKSKSDIGILGMRIKLISGQETIEGIAVDINEDGSLVLRTKEGNMKTFNFGEITLRRAI